jgi:hypothetical protein
LVALYSIEPDNLGTQTLIQKVIGQTSLSMAFGSKHALDLVFYSGRATLDVEAKRLAEDRHLAVVTNGDVANLDWIGAHVRSRFIEDNRELIKVNNAKLREVAAIHVLEIMRRAATMGIDVTAVRAANGLVGEQFDASIQSRRVAKEVEICVLHSKYPTVFGLPPYFREAAKLEKKLLEGAKRRAVYIAKVKGKPRKERDIQRALDYAAAAERERVKRKMKP